MPQAQGADIVYVSDDLTSNSLGRAYCLWLLSEHIGLRSSVVAASGDYVWHPLSVSKFASYCSRVDDGAIDSLGRGEGASLVVCVKALPESFALARQLADAWSAPLLLDIDDPDIEAGLSEGEPLKAAGKWVLRPRRTFAFRRLAREAHSLPLIVSNPELQLRYGGTLIPHVRPPLPAAEVGQDLTVAFVGTNRPHKGLALLREAVASLQNEGFTLLVTDWPPPDARPWERWVGRTTIAEGLELLRASAVAVVPSLDTVFARGQLPAKVVDAMSLGVPVVASDLPPIRWALGETGLLFEPGNVAALTVALRELVDKHRRTMLAEASRARARRVFGVDENAQSFYELYRRVVAS